MDLLLASHRGPVSYAQRPRRDRPAGAATALPPSAWLAAQLLALEGVGALS